jgi:SAM-dependent methyltransferase
MGHIFTAQEAQDYFGWSHRDPGERVLALERGLLRRVFQPRPGEHLLEVGCGTGVFTAWFADMGLQVTGLDASPHMLQLARSRLPGRVALERGYAEDLPYEDNSFDTVALITSLEFTDDPLRALQEACRVAKARVLLGVLNKYSLIALQRRLELLWSSSIYRHARFFGVFELKRMVSETLGGRVPMTWRTCLSLPLGIVRYLYPLEESRYFQWHPWGHFIAMRVDLCYTLRTLQQPLFPPLPSRVGPTQRGVTCWRSPGRQQPERRPYANC